MLFTAFYCNLQPEMGAALVSRARLPVFATRLGRNARFRAPQKSVPRNDGDPPPG